MKIFYFQYYLVSLSCCKLHDIGHKGDKVQTGENRQCNIEHKSDEGKGQWCKPSAQATEVRISGAS
jgi:hypothetical protein